jgi:putative DNA primase/helicase
MDWEKDFAEACQSADSGRPDPTLIAQCAADVTPEPVEWLWPRRIAIGKQTLVAGEPGLGKSQVSVAMAAAVTTGGLWPCGEGRAPLGNVIILQAEDGVADTVVPRLMAAGADRKRVQLITAVLGPDGRRTFNLQADLELLEKEIARVGNVRLAIIDPISSYLGPKVDSHVNAAVRGVLEPVGEMAARLRLAILSNTHFTKGAGIKAINRFIGSIAFVAAARAAFVVTKDTEDESRCLFLPVKNNLAPLGKGLAYRLEQRLVGDPGKGIVASSVVWEGEPVMIAVDQALQAADAQDSGKGSAGAEAEELLRDALATGSAAVKDIQAQAKEAGLSWGTVRRAKERVGVEAQRESDGFAGGGRWLWKLSDSHKVLTSPTRCSSLGMSTLCENEHLVAPSSPEVGKSEPRDIDPDRHQAALDRPAKEPQPDDGLDIPEFLCRRPGRRCDHCGSELGIMNSWDCPGRPDGIWLHPRCEEGWHDAESPSARRGS